MPMNPSVMTSAAVVCSVYSATASAEDASLPDSRIAEHPRAPFTNAMLYQTIAPGWQMCQILWLNIEIEGDTFIVSDDLFAVYGTGETSEQALQDYITSIIEYYRLLKGRAERNTETRKLFNYLRSYLKYIGDAES